MQQAIYRLPFLLSLLLAVSVVVAQKADTIKPLPKKIPLVMDGKNAVNKEYSIVLDSLDIKEGRLHIENGKMYLVQNDSLHRRNDSLFKRNNVLFRRNDSLFRKNDGYYSKAKKAYQRDDSVFRKQAKVFKESRKLDKQRDSLYKLNTKLFKQSNLNFKQSRKLDSLRSLNWKKDSVRIKKDLNNLDSHLRRLKNDSLKSPQMKYKKLITFEMDCTSDGQVRIENVGRKLIIKTTTENKVRLETVTFVEEGADGKNVDWEKVFNIAITGNKNKVVIKKAHEAAPQATYQQVPDKNTYHVNFKSPVTIYVPVAAKLNIEHRYNELVIMDNLLSVELNLLNTQLQMKDAEKATIKSRYGSVNTGIIKNADLDLLNCNLSSVELTKAIILSKYSSIVLKKTIDLAMKSFSDQYKIDYAKDISGSKSFGQFTIARLDNTIALSGSSADLTINSIDPAATKITLDNKYATVKLPVQKLQNYSLQFDGDYSNIVTPFENIKTGTKDSVKNSIPAFSKTVGMSGAAFTSFVVNCISCSVDFR